MYKPLPAYLSIGPSDIHGAGIFAVEDIPAEVVMGITHIYDTDFEDDYIRTPLGGFINHSDNPNCEKVKLQDENYTKYNLISIKDITGGDELTVKYSFYNMSSNGSQTISEKLQDELEPIVNAPMMDTE